MINSTPIEDACIDSDICKDTLELVSQTPYINKDVYCQLMPDSHQCEQVIPLQTEIIDIDKSNLLFEEATKYYSNDPATAYDLLIRAQKFNPQNSSIKEDIEIMKNLLEESD